MKFQSTNSGVVKLFWMVSMMIFEVYELQKLYEVKWYKKWQKGSSSGQFSEGVPVQVQGCTGTGHQRLTYAGTSPTCTGTGQQNATCTSTGPRCTGTGEPKMPRMLCFYTIKSNSYTDSLGTLGND